MTIRLKDGSGFETKPGSNIITDGTIISWFSIHNRVQSIAIAHVKQIEP